MLYQIQYPDGQLGRVYYRSIIEARQAMIAINVPLTAVKLIRAKHGA